MNLDGVRCGGFNWSSQPLETGGVRRWVLAGGGSRFERCVARCGRPGGRRPRGARIGCASGRRSHAGRRVRTLLQRPECHARLAPGGSARCPRGGSTVGRRYESRFVRHDHGLHAVSYSELLEDMGHVGLDGGFAEGELSCDLGVSPGSSRSRAGVGV